MHFRRCIFSLPWRTEPRSFCLPPKLSSNRAAKRTPCVIPPTSGSSNYQISCRANICHSEVVLGIILLRCMFPTLPAHSHVFSRIPRNCTCTYSTVDSGAGKQTKKRIEFPFWPPVRPKLEPCMERYVRLMSSSEFETGGTPGSLTFGFG